MYHNSFIGWKCGPQVGPDKWHYDGFFTTLFRTFPKIGYKKCCVMACGVGFTIIFPYVNGKSLKNSAKKLQMKYNIKKKDHRHKKWYHFKKYSQKFRKTPFQSKKKSCFFEQQKIKLIDKKNSCFRMKWKCGAEIGNDEHCYGTSKFNCTKRNTQCNHISDVWKFWI